MTTPPSDEELAEWERNNVEMGEDYPGVRLIQEVRRLRDERSTNDAIWSVDPVKAVAIATLNQRAEKAEAAFQQAVVDSTQMRADLEKAEAEVTRLRELADRRGEAIARAGKAEAELAEYAAIGHEIGVHRMRERLEKAEAERDTKNIALDMALRDMAILKDQQDRYIKALNGFRWLGNNLHNIKADPDEFEKYYRAALSDALAAFDQQENNPNK